MYKYDKIFLEKKAHETGFMQNTLEKVYRLVDILEYFNKNPVLQNSLALKGGTAINLTIFNLPRLSVDIDLDYTRNTDRVTMLEERRLLNTDISKYMMTQGYTVNPRTKTPHALDSLMYTYINTGGNKDNIKIEINYSLRAHILPYRIKTVASDIFETNYDIRILDPIEIIASKTNALLSRAAARDLYDIYNIQRSNFLKVHNSDLLRRCTVFYAAISAEKINRTFDASKIDLITFPKIKRDLFPVIREKGYFPLEEIKTGVKQFIAELMTLTPSEIEFLALFEKKSYQPQLLFPELEILDRIKSHPMALWKMMNHDNKK